MFNTLQTRAIHVPCYFVAHAKKCVYTHHKMLHAKSRHIPRTRKMCYRRMCNSDRRLCVHSVHAIHIYVMWRASVLSLGLWSSLWSICVVAHESIKLLNPSATDETEMKSLHCSSRRQAPKIPRMSGASQACNTASHIKTIAKEQLNITTHASRPRVVVATARARVFDVVNTLDTQRMTPLRRLRGASQKWPKAVVILCKFRLEVWRRCL